MPPTHNDLLEEFHKECDKNPQLKPLHDILGNLHHGSKSNAKLFYDVWQFVHQNDELRALFEVRADDDLKAVGRALVSHVEEA
jgi:hypothetical protein